MIRELLPPVRNERSGGHVMAIAQVPRELLARFVLIAVITLLSPLAVQAAGETRASGVRVPHFSPVKDDACARRTSERVRALMLGADFVPAGPRIAARNRPCK
jgi:hypothetical protein